MKKAMLVGVIAGIISVPVFGADPAPVPAPAQVPVATPAPQAPAAAPAMDQAITAIPLRSLRAVQDVRESDTPWQKAVDDAVAKINNPSLKTTVSQQLARVSPQVAKALLQRPGQSAMVTVAVYRQRGTDRQALAAVAYEGLGDGLNPSFYPRVLANLPRVPGAKEDQIGKLELDPDATSYLCYFLDRGDLKAGDISHSQMKRSLDLAIEQARQNAKTGAGAGVLQPQQPANTQAQAPVNPSYVVPHYGEAAQANSPVPPDTDWTTPYWADDGAADPYLGYDGWLPWVAYVGGYNEQPQIVRPNYRDRARLHHDHAQGADAAIPARANQSPGPISAEIDHAVRPTTPGTPRPVEPNREPGTVARPAEERPVAPARAEPAPARPEPAPAHAEAPAAAHEAPAAHDAPAAHEAPAGGGGHPAPAPAEHK